jgi:type VI secretion system protein VasI
MKVLKLGCASLFLVFAISFFVQKGIVEPAEKRDRAAKLASRLASPERKWTTERGRSSFDDSPTVSLTLEAEAPMLGWPDRIETPALVLRCQEHKTEAYIRTGMAPNVEYGRLREAAVRLRLDQEPASRIVASESTDNKALFFAEPISLIRSLLKHERLTFGFTPFNSSAVETAFDLRGLDAAIKPLRDACGW